MSCLNPNNLLNLESTHTSALSVVFAIVQEIIHLHGLASQEYLLSFCLATKFHVQTDIDIPQKCPRIPLVIIT
jgi:hypothetical protein